jgi:EamA-like transporter family
MSAQNIGATRSQILFSTAPLWGVIFSYLFYHDSFQWVHIISIALLASAVIVTNLLTHLHLHTHKAMEHIHYHQHTDGHHTHSHINEKVSERSWHLHSHIHTSLTHEHSHDPDLHHRYEHS